MYVQPVASGASGEGDILDITGVGTQSCFLVARWVVFGGNGLGFVCGPLNLPAHCLWASIPARGIWAASGGFSRDTPIIAARAPFSE